MLESGASNENRKEIFYNKHFTFYYIYRNQFQQYLPPNYLSKNTVLDCHNPCCNVVPIYVAVHHKFFFTVCKKVLGCLPNIFIQIFSNSLVCLILYGSSTIQYSCIRKYITPIKLSSQQPVYQKFEINLLSFFYL